MLTDLSIPMTVSGTRLDKILALAHPNVSRKAIIRAFNAGHVTIDGRTAHKSWHATEGKVIRIAQLEEMEDLVARTVEAPLKVIYESDEFLAFDKPAGQDCSPVQPDEADTLVNAMLARYPELATIGGNPMIPALLHRLDGGTSGVVLAARTEEMHKGVRELFAAQQIEKRYCAIVEGVVTAPGGVTGHLAHHRKKAGKMRVVGPQATGAMRTFFAETFYEPFRAYPDHTLLGIVIRTGVTHQIRCQLASIGHPIVGDILYGANPTPLAPSSRFFLHAYSVSLTPPGASEPLRVTAPLPDDFKAALEALA